MDYAGGKESEWLELKASVQLSEEYQKRGDSPKDLYWNIAKAIIAISNTIVGAVIIGIDDHCNPISLKGNAHGSSFEEEYYRKQVYDKVWGSDEKGKNGQKKSE